MVKLVIFDMDGLMIDTERLWMEMFIELGKQSGFVLREEQYKAAVALDLESEIIYWSEFCGGREQASSLLKQCRERLNQYVRENGVPVKYGLYELLEYLKENDIRTAIASSSSREVIHQYLKSAGVYEYFPVIVSADDCKKGKPDPEIFLKACACSGYELDEAIILEDSINGIKAAREAGIFCVGIPDLFDLKDMRGLSGVVIKDNLKQVIDLLE